tara:strand:- start:364 stop:939 length:576 start_codon:yes stop_codon:yes gene_type:complete
VIIEHLKYPFYHTIIYNYFEDIEIQKIVNEIDNIEYQKLDDRHHTQLKNKAGSVPICLDNVYSDRRDDSQVLFSISNIINLKLEQYVDKNPFLGYLPMTNTDLTYVQKYRNGSHYFAHSDTSVLTFLYPIHLKEFDGGQLYFTDHDYTPRLEHNSILIFPSYKTHKLKEIKSKHDGFVRYSINQRFFIQTC